MITSEETDRIDFVIKRFQEISVKYEEIQLLVKGFHENFVELVDFKTECIENLKFIMDFLETLRSCNDNINRIQKDFDIQKVNISNLLDFQKSQPKIDTNIRNSFAILSEQMHDMQESAKTFSKIDENQSLSKKIDDLTDSLTDQIKDFVDFSQKMSVKMPDICFRLDDLENLKTFSDSLKKDLQKNVESIAWLSNARLQDNDISSQRIQILSDALDKRMNDKLLAIPKPEIPSLDDIKKSMESQLEPAFLDAKNANLRSVNNETKITLMQKKIEQLQLVINKLNLQG